MTSSVTVSMKQFVVDLQDLRGNTQDGIHAASAGGLWQALAFGFAGICLTEAGPVAWPRLPEHWEHLAFSVHWRGTRFSFFLTPDMRGPIPPKASPHELTPGSAPG
jgi:kojibiose phosphorylase